MPAFAYRPRIRTMRFGRLFTRVLAQESKRRYIDVKTRKSLGQKVFYALRRLDILQPLLEDESITEIMVNGPNHVFVERMGKLERSREQFESKQRLEDLIQQDCWRRQSERSMRRIPLSMPVCQMDPE